jgi:hypothetical protein
MPTEGAVKAMSGSKDEPTNGGIAPRMATAAVLVAAMSLSTAAETGGAMMFKYPGVNCISESVAADGIFNHSTQPNPAEYSGTAIENAPSFIDPATGLSIDTPVEVFCPIPHIQILKAEEFFPSVVDLRGSSVAEGLLYYEVQAFVDDNAALADIECAVLATDAEVDGGVFDWEISGHLTTTPSVGQTVLRWSMLSSAPSMSVFLTLHCVLPPTGGGDESQIIGYGLKKARLVP